MKPADYLWVLIGGGLGSAARFALSYFWAGAFWINRSTLVANIIAALLAGMLAQRVADGGLTRPYALLLATGFCGGLSTFSTFSVESLKYLQHHQWMLFAMHTFLHVSLSLAAAAIGWGVASTVTP